MPLVRTNVGNMDLEKVDVRSYRRLEVSGTSYGRLIYVTLANSDDETEIQTNLGDNRASTSWPSVSVTGNRIKVQANGGGNDDYGFPSVTITAYDSGTFKGSLTGAYAGTVVNINDWFDAGQSRTYSAPAGNYGVGGFRGIFE